jgi:diaminohydroxyphosphoribosylaminopyrimidine deaminase/5-amino-6-(5-phosphoribosylamino)uracil reductase
MKVLTDKGAEVFEVEEKNGKPSVAAIVKMLAGRGVTRLMVEAGAVLTTAFVNEGLADRLYWFRAPVTVGEKGLPILNHEALLAGFTKAEARPLGQDMLEVLERA